MVREGSPRRRVLLPMAAPLALLLPFALWQCQPVRPLKVLIVDKTVPDEGRREHAGLSWLLRHRKFRQPGGTDYQAAVDYYGFFPMGDRRWEVREPSIPAAAPELIYLADTYGVYWEEFHGKALGNRTEKLYGGLRPEELASLEAALPRCLTLVGEFNTFASPTGEEARRASESLFSLKWNGWIGRHFKDLRRDLEVPPWAVRNWERRAGQPWVFDGPGFLLVNARDEVEVLAEGVEAAPHRGLRFHGLPAGRAALDLPSDVRYDYWFDFVHPEPGTEVMAEFELPLLPAGEARMRALGLPGRTPAVLASRKGSTRIYYLAGDFVDAWPPPHITRAAGLVPFRRFVTREVPGDPQAFFWKVYVPLMSRVLEDTWERKGQ